MNGPDTVLCCFSCHARDGLETLGRKFATLYRGNFAYLGTYMNACTCICASARTDRPARTTLPDLDAIARMRRGTERRAWEGHKPHTRKIPLRSNRRKSQAAPHCLSCGWGAAATADGSWCLDQRKRDLPPPNAAAHVLYLPVAFTIARAIPRRLLSWETRLF